MIEITQLENLPKIDGGFYYIACPYGDRNKELVEKRMRSYERVDARLSSLGHFVMSPLDKHYKLKEGNLPGDYRYWQHYCKAMLKLCKGLVVIIEPGWEHSVGVQDEIAEARKLKLPIYYV